MGLGLGLTSLIMVVADDADWRDLVGDLLMLEGYEVVFAADASETLALLEHHQPHLFICKIPDVSQIVAFTEAVRPKRRQIPFLYIGPFHPSSWQPDHALIPPFLPQEFLLAVKHILMRYS